MKRKADTRERENDRMFSDTHTEAFDRTILTEREKLTAAEGEEGSSRQVFVRCSKSQRATSCMRESSRVVKEDFYSFLSISLSSFVSYSYHTFRLSSAHQSIVI